MLFSPKNKRLAADERFSDVTFLDVNAEKNPEARKAAGVTTLPYFAIFRNGQLVEALSTSKEETLVELLGKLH
jgi:thioredoxin-like negative regulator of GroEL